MRRPAATLQPEQEHGVTANYETSWQRRWRRMMRPPLADVRGTFWPDTSEITLLEAAVLSGHAKTRRDTRRLCLDSVLVFADVRRKKRTSWGCSWRSLLMERCCHVLDAVSYTHLTLPTNREV